MAEIIFYSPLRQTGIKPLDDRGGTGKAARTTRVESDRVGEAHRDEVAADCPLRKRRPFPCLHDAAKASRGARWQIGTDCGHMPSHSDANESSQRSAVGRPEESIFHESSDIAFLTPALLCHHFLREKSLKREAPGGPEASQEKPLSASRHERLSTLWPHGPP